MRNKKIVINIDVKNRRVRRGFIDSNIHKVSDKKDSEKQIIEDDKNKTKKEKKSTEKRKEDSFEKNEITYNDEYLKKEDNSHLNINSKEKKQEEKIKIEYIKKSEIEKISKGINIVNKYKKKEKKEREKRIGKTLNEVEKEKKEKLKEKDTINFNSIFISIFLVIFIVFLYVFFEYGPILGITLNLNEVLVKTKIDLVSNENDFYFEYNDELLIYSNQNITTYNKNGKKTWSYTLDKMFTPKIYIKDSFMVVTNNTNGNIYMFENKKEILNMKVDGKINKVYLDSNGYLAVEHASNGYKKIIGIYDKNGKHIYNTYLENDTIADIKLLDNAKKIIVTKINSTSFKAGIEILLIDSTKSEENIKQIAKLDNNLVYDLTIQGQNIIMLLDNELINININTGEKFTIKSFETSQVLYFTLNDNYFTCVEKELNNIDNEYIINNVRFDGTVISSIKVMNSPKLVSNSGLLSYYIYQNNYNVVNKWGIEVSNKELTNVPKDIVIFNNEKAIALIYTNVVYIENL